MIWVGRRTLIFGGLEVAWPWRSSWSGTFIGSAGSNECCNQGDTEKGRPAGGHYVLRHRGGADFSVNCFFMLEWVPESFSSQTHDCWANIQGVSPVLGVEGFLGGFSISLFIGVE